MPAQKNVAVTADKAKDAGLFGGNGADLLCVPSDDAADQAVDPRLSGNRRNVAPGLVTMDEQQRTAVS